MLRKKKDSLKDIPKDVRHSLQFFDNLLDELDDETGGSTLRNMKKVPADARKSLQILDNVLGEFDIGDLESPRSESADNLRITLDATEEVRKSIEILDTVLDEFKNEGGKTIVPRKPKSESLKRPRHEDVRRSLEVLDSVLAEFDDCLESWDSTVHDIRPPEDSWLKKDREINADANSSISYDSQTTDGSTSHDSGLSLQEQVKVTSPPPVPKRSATTKLSDRNSGLFVFSDIQSFDSLSSDSAFQDNGTNLSINGAITTLSAKDDDEVFNCHENNEKFGFCEKCGSEIDLKKPGMDKNPEKDASSSPFLERRKMFEGKMGGDSKKISVSPLLERSFKGSSFKVRTNVTKECESEPSSLVYYKTSENDRSEISHSSFASKYSPKATKVDPPRVDGILSLPSNPQHAPNCNCKERLRQLQIKFAETRRLLKANKIRGTDAKPPSFVPAPPPIEVLAKNSRNVSPSSNKQLCSELSVNVGISDSNSYSASNGSLNSGSFSSEISEVSHPSPVPESEKISKRNILNSDEQNLCNRCSSIELLPISETIEDIPKLRPTDALKRPYLGLSLCMEEDFSPGVKEILQTTSKNSVLLNPNNKMTSLSTFSLSDSSLGYVSSQSDLEISNSSSKGDKVPVSSIKCSTLPQGMDLHSLPSYYGHDDPAGSDRKSNQSLYRDRNFNHTIDPKLRNSSNSPMPEATEKPKKKHFRGFSRKDKDKKKNEDNISVTSYLSLDDEMILKAIDGSTYKSSAVDSKETGVEKKKWSALRSFLGKK